MSAEAQRLLQALEHFNARSRGAELPEGVSEAVEGLQKALGQPEASRDTPGAREALKLAPGTGTGVPMEQAAKGPDKGAESQGEGSTLTAAIEKAAQKAVAEMAGGQQQQTPAA